MCAICMKSPCDSRCPNAPDPPAVFNCKGCGEGILVGDEYAEIDGERYHIECLDDMTTLEILKLFDVEIQTAEMEESGW